MQHIHWASRDGVLVAKLKHDGIMGLLTLWDTEYGIISEQFGYMPALEQRGDAWIGEGASKDYIE